LEGLPRSAPLGEPVEALLRRAVDVHHQPVCRVGLEHLEQLAEDGEHLLAQGLLDQGRLVGVVAAEDLASRSTSASMPR
jgi:hypothetical protein